MHTNKLFYSLGLLKKIQAIDFFVTRLLVGGGDREGACPSKHPHMSLAETADESEDNSESLYTVYISNSCLPRNVCER